MAGADGASDIVISIFLADDHPVVLKGIRLLLEAQKDFCVIGQETDAFRIVENACRLKPDVLVLDYMMPGPGVTEIIEAVVGRCPDTKVVVLSMHANTAYVWEALHSGAVAYVLKCSESEELMRAIRAAAAGSRYLSPPLAEKDIESYSQRVRQSGMDPYEMLSRREKQVLKLVAEGNTSSQVAEMLRIGTRTAESHRASILHKLGLRNQVDLVRYAIQKGIVPPE